MLPLRTAFFLLMLGLAGCAAPAPEPIAQARRMTPALPRHGIILAMRPVPDQAIGAVRVLAPELAAAEHGGDPHLFEYIVRTGSGTTLAIVQPAGGRLRPGEVVGLLPGAPARIAALPSQQ